MNNEYSTEFTDLFLELNKKAYLRSKVFAKHPFENLESKIGESTSTIEKNNPDSLKKTFLEIKRIEESCLRTFEFESCLLVNNNQKYINECVKILTSIKAKIHNQRKSYKEFEFFEYIILNSVHNLLFSISNKYAFLLNAENRQVMKRIFSFEKPILSFQLINNIEKNKFNMSFSEYLSGKLVDFNHSAEEFMQIINHQRLENKINWIGSNNSLSFFIRELQNSGLIKPTKNKHWKIACEFFLVKGAPIIPKHLKVEPTEKKSLRNLIINFFQFLK